MSLRINTNVAALNAYNNLSANQSKLEGAFQQLSSGLRINKAADDAAGLSIAQGLTSQINGLTQGVSNAQDGINVAQIADGALGTTQDILQRMRTLVVKAANTGTQDSDSLGAIQQEIQNLNTQLDNIAGQTKFGQTNLLDGSYNKNFQVGANGGDTIGLNLTGANVVSSNVANTGINLNNLAIATSVAPTFVAGGTVKASGVGSSAADGDIATMLGQANAAAITFGAADANGTQKIIASGDPTATTLGTVTFNSKAGTYSVANAQGTVVGKIDVASYGTLEDANFTTNGLAAASPAAGSMQAFLDGASGSTSAAGKDYVFSPTSGVPNSWDVSFGTTGSEASVGTLTLSNGVYKFDDGSGNVSFFNTNEKNTAAGISSYSSDSATADLAALDKAINGISNARSQIGAVQNQLNYTVSNLQTAITNVTASRSNLTDADLAQQVTTMTQSQILTQAATSVLAQANSAPQAILKLLQ